MFGFSDKKFAFITSEKISEIASQLALELGHTCGVGLIPTAVLSAGVLMMLKKKPTIMRFFNMTWNPEDGSSSNRRDSVEPETDPPSSSCVDGTRGSDLDRTQSTRL